MPQVSITDPADPPPYALSQFEEADVVLLPMYMDGDQAIYADGTTMAVKRLRALGARAAWAHDASHRAWYGERGAGEVVVAFVVGILSSAGWDAIKLFFSQGSAHVQLKMFYRTSTDGSEERWIELQGHSKDVSDVLDRLHPWKQYQKDGPDGV